jgi:hypothetical protein
MKLSAIVQIHKYKRFHEGHHFIPMAMECMAHLGMIWIISSRNVPIFSILYIKVKMVSVCLSVCLSDDGSAF